VVFMRQRRDLRPEWWLCLVIVLLSFLVDAARGQNSNGWSGGASVTSRHLVPMLPFMIVPIAFCFRDRAFRVAFVVLAAVSAALMFMAVSATNPFRYADKHPLVNELLANFFHGKLVPNWVSVWTSTLDEAGYSTLLLFFALALCLVGRLVWLLHAAPHPAQQTRTDHRKAELEAS